MTDMERTVQPLKGHLASFTAYVIFGLNIIASKGLANSGAISPLGLFCFRAIGASALFWIAGLFIPKEKIDKGDYLKIFAASMIGLYLTQIAFLKAITQTTPTDAAILSAFAPIMTMFFAAIFLKEPITFKKMFGVAMSFSGAILLVFNSVNTRGGADHTTPLGGLLLFVNCMAFAFYLGFFKPLIQKYHVVTFMKWMFLFSALASVPFDLKEIVTLPYSQLPASYLLQLGYLIVCATFIAYFLIPIGQQNLRPTLVSMYSYIQPLIATAVSVMIGMDRITWQKVLSAVLVFGGVFVVNRSRQRGDRSAPVEGQVNAR